MSHIIKIPAVCICENKGADQLHGNRAAHQRLCFHQTNSTIPQNFKPIAIFCDCAAWFVSDLVGNGGHVSQDAAQLIKHPTNLRMSTLNTNMSLVARKPVFGTPGKLIFYRS